MAGKSSFRQPIRHGIDTGTANGSSLGNAVITQRASVSASETTAVQKFLLPGDTEGGTVANDIIGFDVIVKDVFEASAAASVQIFYGSAAGTELGKVRVSAVGTYRVLPGQAENNNGVRTAFAATSADAFLGLGGTDRAIFVQVSAVGTPPDTGHANVVVHYVPR